MDDHAAISYWLETSGDDLVARPALDGSTDCDVAILGGGYSGLWTAYYLLKRDPTLRIVIVEQEICGFGASGRNGAWCAPGLNISLDRLARLHGSDAARRIYAATFDAVDEVGRIAGSEGLDIEWRRGGELTVARGAHQDPGLEESMRELERFGFADRYRLLDRAGVGERVNVDGATSGLYTPDSATIHPGKLVRGLARLVERMGARIVERTEVADYRGGPQPTLITHRGDVRARVLVLAGEAYLTRLRKLHRQLIPVWSLIVLTEPLPDEVWEQVGWQAHECIGSNRLTVVYLSRTTDGRILFGGRGAPYRFGSPIRPEYDHHDPTHDMLRRLAREWFPAIRDATFTHAWGGPLGMPRDWHPTFAFDRRSGIATARGYVGHGVSTANLGGRTLADLITGERTELTELPLAQHRSPNWEPEPFRWLGVRYTQAAIGRVDAKAERTGRPPSGRSLAEIIARH
jgi:glycine/D-amino acid oxidase-like deaminating enzyme